MTFVITQNCCTDASCVPVCPVDCIRPIPGDDARIPPMLYIDPETCVDCGACAQACPVGAVYHEDELPADQQRFKNINADYFTRQPLTVRSTAARDAPGSIVPGTLRVAVVGAGPAAGYAVSELVRIGGAEVNVFEKLPTPFGLVRFGVAPDHQRTKDIADSYASVLANSGVRCYFNVEVGRDLTHSELLAHHHALIYAVGAARSRTLGIPGEELPGSHAGADVVAWYNGHPHHADLDFDLSGRRAVIIGNGNVALDIARILLMDHVKLTATDTAKHALDRLADSAIDEVVILGRRGAADAAFSVAELLALGDMADVDVVVEGDIGERPHDDFDRALKYDIVCEYARRAATPGRRRIALRFFAAPVRIVGTHRVEGVEVAAGSGTRIVATNVVLRSIGYCGSPVAGLPFDEMAGTIPNDGGRVVQDGQPMAGVYATGWIKRGPRGVIGTNRTCAHETVGKLLGDYRAGLLPVQIASAPSLDAILESRGVRVVDWAGWCAIDALERRQGATESRARAKIVGVESLLSAASGTRVGPRSGG